MFPEKPAILHAANDWGAQLNDIFTAVFEKKGGSITGRENADSGEPDFRSPLIKLLGKKPDVFYIAPYPAEMGAALKQLRELGYAGPIIATDTIQNDKVVAASGGGAEGVVYTTTKSAQPEEFTRMLTRMSG